ncbi:MAG: 2-amino-4-hydroxy-6-hydroxymethyldihydropteridine diphosphokinase [Xanthomonadaceae bacterium]|nr:2-amino-4-hydroxy-6-hydroxymethyldihydropteridine diphosphokinase [Xanthomonadaceae bacterium]
MPARRWLLLLGSNLAEPQRMHDALAALAALGAVVAATPILRLPARGDATRGYYNALATLESGLDREALRARLKQIEHGLGRRRDGSGEVAIDIDLLATREADRWQPDPHALEKDEFTQTPARELLEAAGISIVADPRPRED